MKIKKTIPYLALLCSSTNYFSAHDITSKNAQTLNQVEEIFTNIYKTNNWSSQETVSGPGSELRFTYHMRAQLSSLIKRFKITSIADAPCGDLNWMKYVDIGKCKYTGIDIVKELIESNIKNFGSTKEFKHLNLIENVIDKVDLIICRDMLAHLTYEQIITVLRNFKQSGSHYILMTTNPFIKNNHDLSKTGECRFLNLELPPFNLPCPLALIAEDTPFEWERGKQLGLWFLDDINV